MAPEVHTHSTALKYSMKYRNKVCHCFWLALVFQSWRPRCPAGWKHVAATRCCVFSFFMLQPAFPRSRLSSLCTTWCPQRCWPSLKTPPTSCWSCLRTSVTCSETPRCTARPFSSHALLRPTTTHGRSREGTGGGANERENIVQLPLCFEFDSYVRELSEVIMANKSMMTNQRA